jgi:SAM-dependent methyltransferase
MGFIQNQIFREDPWDYLHPYAAKLFGPDIQNRDKRAIWCKAIFCGGNDLRLWNKAVELKIALLSTCALSGGLRVILIAKYATESGLARALRSLLGREGHLTVEEIAPKALASFSQIHPATGKRLQWDFKYFDSIPDQSVDRVILFGAASHIGNLNECLQHIHRVLRSGGRLIIADAPWGGRDLVTAAHLDAHLEGFVARILSGVGVKEEELPQIGPEDLMAVSKSLLHHIRTFSWQGLYTFCGQKEGEDTSWEFPPSTEAVRVFLNEKSSESPWDFLVDQEIDALGSEVKESNLQKKWGRAIFFGSNLRWCWMNARSIMHLMYSNLKAKPGNRVLVIGEFLEELEFLPELHKQIGETGEIAAVDMVEKSRSGREQQWKTGPNDAITEKHQWDYPFADKYPDNYFDLIWFPQGVHHAYSWNKIAPRFLRALKPEGQIMMAECRVPSPEFHHGIQMSGMLQCIVDKIFWAMDMTLEEMPDYSTAEITRAFGDSLTDTFCLEWKGFLLFWGYKR